MLSLIFFCFLKNVTWCGKRINQQQDKHLILKKKKPSMTPYTFRVHPSIHPNAFVNPVFAPYPVCRHAQTSLYPSTSLRCSGGIPRLFSCQNRGISLVRQSKHLTKMTRDKAGIFFFFKRHTSQIFMLNSKGWVLIKMFS